MLDFDSVPWKELPCPTLSSALVSIGQKILPCPLSSMATTEVGIGEYALLGSCTTLQSVCAGAILLCSSDVLSLKEIKEFLSLA